MKSRFGLVIVLCGIVLSACSRPTSTAETTPQVAPTLAATSATGSGLGSMSSIGAPTAAPTTEPTANAAQTYTVRRGTVEDLLTFSGQVAPMQATIAFTLDGIVAKLHVQPGQTIQKGDLVAELDTGDLATQLRTARLAYEQNQRNLDRATQSSQLVVKQAELDLETAQQTLAELKAPPSSVVLTEAQTAVRQAEANLASIRNNASQTKNAAKASLDQTVQNLQTLQADYGLKVNLLAKTKNATEKKTLSDAILGLETQIHAAEAAVTQAVITYDTARNNEVAVVKDAEAKLDLAKAKLNALLRGPDQFQLATQERAVRRAELALTKARLDGTADPALTSAIEASRLQIKDLEAAIAAKQLFAPYGGEVATIAAIAGSPIQGGVPVITLVDRSRIEIVADSTAIDSAGRKTPPVLTIGQAVAITFSRYPGQVLTGTIRLVPNTQQPDATDKYYHISFEPQGLNLAAGDLADLEVSLGRKYDALWLPPVAVKFNGTRASVNIRVDGKNKQLEVLTGIVSADKVEILSGLKENDLVFGT